MQNKESVDVLVVGAGPAGSVAASLLKQQGLNVLVVEKELFPRFSIGESLLPQSMEYIEAAGLLQAVVEAGFQYKNGAGFAWGEDYTDFDFRNKFSKGWGTTYQVQRARFDKVLADAAAAKGITFRFQHTVTAIDLQDEKPQVTVQDPMGSSYTVEARWVLDASGFGRLLPRLLDLESPSDFPVRGAIFTHIQDNIPLGTFDRNKIRVTVHPVHCDVWFWLIPFSDGRCSLGVVAKREFLEQYQGTDTERLQTIVAEDAGLSKLLGNAIWDTPARHITGYASNVKSLWGKGFALLGNAGEFLDPVFSSGVTIAFKSASLAVECIRREIAGETVDWETDYALALRKGVDAFRAFVDAWYRGGFQNIIFFEDQNPEIRGMICAILAGYAWDENNPYVAHPKRRVAALEALCSTPA